MNENKKSRMNEIDEPKLEQVTGGEGGIVEERAIKPNDIYAEYEAEFEPEHIEYSC